MQSSFGHQKEFYNHYLVWLNFVHRQTGKMPKRFHTDGGNEFNSGAFSKLFNECGTEFTTTSAGSSNQNPIAERAIRTIMTMARGFLFQAGVPRKYWTEAVAYAVYVKNRLPNSKSTTCPALLFTDISKTTKSNLFD